MSTKFMEGEIKAGGGTFYCMEGLHGTLYGRIQYLKIEAPRNLAYTQQFCDAHQNVARHPMAPTWPETMLTNVTFVEEGSAHTRVTLSWEPHGRTTPEEVETFVNARAGMTLGWTGSFDKLENYLLSGVSAEPSRNRTESAGFSR